MSPRDDTDDDKTFKHRSLLVPILNKLSNKSYTEPLYGYLCIYICIYINIYTYTTNPSTSVVRLLFKRLL